MEGVNKLVSMHVQLIHLNFSYAQVAQCIHDGLAIDTVIAAFEMFVSLSTRGWILFNEYFLKSDFRRSGTTLLPTPVSSLELLPVKAGIAFKPSRLFRVYRGNSQWHNAWDLSDGETEATATTTLLCVRAQVCKSSINWCLSEFRA